MTFRRVASVSELAAGQAKLVELADRALAVFHVEGTFYAVDDECPHEGGSLSQGMVEGCVVTCPWHAARFDVRSGSSCGEMQTDDVTTYAVRVVGEAVEVDL